MFEWIKRYAVKGEQRFDFLSQIIAASARLLEISLSLISRHRCNRIEQLRYFIPIRRWHLMFVQRVHDTAMPWPIANT